MRARKNKPQRFKKSLAYYPSHPDVIWFDDEDSEPVRAKTTKPRKSPSLAIVEPETGVAPTPRDSKALPGTRIDQTFGLCGCWLCRDRPVAQYERDWMFGVLAKDALRKSPVEQAIWLQDWTLRHGKFAGEILKLHMWREQQSQRSHPSNISLSA